MEDRETGIRKPLDLGGRLASSESACHILVLPNFDLLYPRKIQKQQLLDRFKKYEIIRSKNLDIWCVSRFALSGLLYSISEMMYLTERISIWLREIQINEKAF